MAQSYLNIFLDKYNKKWNDEYKTIKKAPEKKRIKKGLMTKAEITGITFLRALRKLENK